jgi:hypothetical protein
MQHMDVEHAVACAVSCAKRADLAGWRVLRGNVTEDLAAFLNG